MNDACDIRRPTSGSLNIGIAGAGLLGRLLAWKLLQQGHHVRLFDRGSREGELSAARVAASMLAPYSEVVSAERQVFDWGLMALRWWPEQIALLEQQTGQTIHYGMAGSVVLAHDLDKSSLRHFEQQLQAKVPDHLDGVERIDRERLRSLEPELADRYSSGLFLADEGYLDNWALLSALEIAISKLGGKWYEHREVVSVAPKRIVLSDETLAFDWVVDSRGLGAKAQLPGLRGVRGEVLWVHAPEVNLQRPVRLMHPRYKLYISPRPGNRYVIGATEIESESMQPVTVRSTLELMSALYSVHSGFAEASLLHAFAHCRPAMPDNLPVLNCEAGLLTVNGLYRHGYLLSPQLVENAVAILTEQTENSVAV